MGESKRFVLGWGFLLGGELGGVQRFALRGGIYVGRGGFGEGEDLCLKGGFGEEREFELGGGMGGNLCW